MVKIGLLSDVHATAAPVAEALALFRRLGIEQILCPGDIAGYGEELDETIDLLIQSGCLAIKGNHDQWYLDRTAVKSELSTGFLANLPDRLELSIEGVKLYMVHASPPDLTTGGIRLLDESGQLITGAKQAWSDQLAHFNHDVLIIGHTHQIINQQLGSTRVINPGSTLFNHACGILSLPEMQFTSFGLSGRDPVSIWRWGQQEY